MFKKHKLEDDIFIKNVMRSSDQKKLKKALGEVFKAGSEELLESLLVVPSKKQTLCTYSCHDRPTLICNPLFIDESPTTTNGSNAFVLFFYQFDSQYVPSLRLVHKYPSLLERVYVDQGAIKHVLQGANVMAPGLVKLKASLPPGLQPNQLVAIVGQDKNLPMAIGRLLIPLDNINENSKGIAIENYHYLGDPLWKFVPSN